MTTVSYAQRFEDLYLLRCFGERSKGFYIDIGSGHPVYDNMSLAFYLKGWHGVTVEPNPWLAQLTRAVRLRDRHVEGVVGKASGTATFHVVHEFHGLSTTIADHAAMAQTQFSRAADTITVPVTTLRELCVQQQVPDAFEFLKVDVEGAEPDVLLNGDFGAFRPQVIVVEALELPVLTCGKRSYKRRAPRGLHKGPPRAPVEKSGMLSWRLAQKKLSQD